MESHGIVGNSLYDADLNASVNFLSGTDTLNPKWWNKGFLLILKSILMNFKTKLIFKYTKS